MILVFLGPPGVGKGTQSQLLAKEIGATIIGVGDYLRRQRRSGTELGKLIQSLIDQGFDVPGRVLMRVIGPSLLEHRRQKIIIDNFLRDRDQVESWFEFSQKNNLSMDGVIHMQADLETCWQRIKKRDKQQVRGDENYDVFLNRYKGVYKSHIKEVIDSLKTRVPIIDIDGRPKISLVFDQIVTKLKENDLWPKK